MSVHEFYRLSEERAFEIMEEIKESVRNWRNVASMIGISNEEQHVKALAFSNSEI